MNVHANPTEDLLGLEGLVTTSVDRDSYPDEMFVKARSTLKKGPCPHCGTSADKVHGHGKDERRFKDVAMHNRMVTIIVERPRYRCTVCTRTWVEQIPSLHDRRMITYRLEEHISKRGFATTFMDIAREFGIDEESVRAIFNEHLAKRNASPRPATPQVLGIDEIHLANDVPCVLTDVRQRKLFDILPSRTIDTITPYFVDLPGKENVDVVVADMYPPYHRIADHFFPGRLNVVDKFHVVRMAGDALDEVRMTVGRQRSQAQKIHLKDERFLLAKRRHDLTDEERSRVEAWLRAFPLLRQAYQIKQRFSDAYDSTTRQEAEREFGRCLQSIPPELDRYFFEPMRAYSNWKDRILNYFIDPVTNAYTESVNSIIRELDRVGRGYSFETMRGIMLYDETVYSKVTSTRSRRPRKADNVVGFWGLGSSGDDDDDYDLFALKRPETRSLDRIAKRLALDPTWPPEND